MQTATLKLETLHRIPTLAEDFDNQVKLLIADCKARPGVTKKRSVKIEVAIEPHPQDPEDVWITPIVSSKQPATQIDPIRGRRTRSGQLQFDFDDALDSSSEGDES